MGWKHIIMQLQEARSICQCVYCLDARKHEASCETDWTLWSREPIKKWKFNNVIHTPKSNNGYQTERLLHRMYFMKKRFFCFTFKRNYHICYWFHCIIISLLINHRYTKYIPEILRDAGFRPLKTNGLNNMCFYNSVSLLLFGDEEHANFLKLASAAAGFAYLHDIKTQVFAFFISKNTWLTSPNH